MNIVSRSEAKLQSLKRYFTGKPCKSGHIAERHTTSGVCWECKAEYEARVRQQDPSINKDRCRKNYQSNREARIKISNDRIKYNRDQHNEYVRRWKKRNKHKVVEYTRARQLTLSRHMPSWVDRSEIDAIYAEAQFLSETTGIKHHVDHIFPLNGKNSCGLHIPANLRVITASENLKKSNTMPGENE